MADGDAPSDAGTVNFTALGVGASGLITLIGGLTVTGSVGRVLRNDPAQITWALVLVVLGAALLGAAGLPATGKPTEVVFSILGLELTLAGLIIAGVTAIGSGHEAERPAITAKLDDSGHLTGSVVAGNLSSDSSFVAVVEGMDGPRSKPAELERTNIGPDGDGKVDLDLDVLVPAGRFQTVRVRGWSAAADGSDRAPGAVLSLPLAPAPASPSVETQWLGTKTDTDRLKVHVTAENARAANGTQAARRVAVVVKRRRTGGYLRFYRGIFSPDGSGKLDTTFEVPIAAGAHRLCVGAAFVDQTGHFPRVACRGAVEDLRQADRTVVELRQPDPPKHHQ